MSGKGDHWEVFFCNLKEIERAGDIADAGNRDETFSPEKG